MKSDATLEQSLPSAGAQVVFADEDLAHVHILCMYSVRMYECSTYMYIHTYT